MEIRNFLKIVREKGSLKGKIKDEERWGIGSYLVEINKNGFCVAREKLIIYAFFYGKEIISKVSIEEIFREIQDIEKLSSLF